MQIKTLSIVIPVFNEGKTVHLILNKVRDVTLINGIEKELIVVNDCSWDESGAFLDEMQKKYERLKVVTMRTCPSRWL